MALTINTNISSLFAQQALNNTQTSLSDTLQRLSTGLRINNASDDPAGLAISETMGSTINGLMVGSRNGNDGISLVQTAQGAMQQVLNNLSRMRELAAQAANGTNGSTDISNLNTEFTALLNEINRAASTTNFNGVSILTTGTITIQIGPDNSANDRIDITLTDVSTGSTGLNISTLSLTDQSTAQGALDSLNSAINSVTTGLANIGSSQANLKAAIANNDTFSTNLQNARSRIEDADFAEESSNLAKFNILSRSGVSMLAQANAVPQLVLQLLQQ